MMTLEEKIDGMIKDGFCARPDTGCLKEKPDACHCCIWSWMLKTGRLGKDSKGIWNWVRIDNKRRSNFS